MKNPDARNALSFFSRLLLASQIATFSATVGVVNAQNVITLTSPDQVLQLFDGKTLAGWNGDPDYWRVEDGAILGEIASGTTLRKNTWLVWTGGELADFDLRVQVRLTGLPAANSGLQFRCQVENYDHVSGYQADFDMGTTWLGRIYDEHGRALLVERGSRVHISADGSRQVESFAPARQYTVLFRENDWNDYRIVAVGNRISVYVNGTLFSELNDEQTNEADLKGSLAFQLHSGPETRVSFRNIQLEHLDSSDKRLPPFELKAQLQASRQDAGIFPAGSDNKPLNLGFEDGTLSDWKATGDAFKRQPVKNDGIAQRWAGQVSNKQGDFFVGGFEVVKDSGTGTLTSEPFTVTHPFGSFLVGGGENQSTRVDLIHTANDGTEKGVIFSASGQNREQMRRVAVNLQELQGESLVIRLVDENPGAWGHLNFDDFRFHEKPPVIAEPTSSWRGLHNPLLHHLQPNPQQQKLPGGETTAQMFVPGGFSVDVIAAEPDLHQPMAFTFDARGRLWVVEGHSYPQKRPVGEGLDRIVIFADNDHDGTFETRKVFIEGLNLVSGMEVGFGGVWIGAAPQLIFIPDHNGDDIPDSLDTVTPAQKSDAPPGATILLDGFGFADTHETLNSFMWGPDGWLYGNQGVFNTSRIGKPGTTDDQRISMSAGVWRYHPIRHVFEVFAQGGSNQWGLDYDEMGQIFMTHCRSFWGKGLTTHVMQGGHYWNQVNSGYAPFVSKDALPGKPHMSNYLLASARYGHGEGGAGKTGSREVYGGHSHVGTMIYLGDNWPDEYHNHLFTHNLHGHQINQQVNHREAGGFNTRHAGSDVFFCADQQYIGVDLKCGPDGAVYISDWYDPRHCHNPNTEQWERGNGRMYRMKYDAKFKPISVDYTRATDAELVEAQSHPNDWHARMARLVLQDRASHVLIAANAVQQLRQMAMRAADPARQLRAIWSLHAIGQLDGETATILFNDKSEYIRAWLIQLLTDAPGPHISETSVQHILVEKAQNEKSFFVRRYLASAIQRVPANVGWQIAEGLCSQSDAIVDRDLPSLIWFGLAPLTLSDIPRAIRLADKSAVLPVSDFIHWYTAAASQEARDVLIQRLPALPKGEQLALLRILDLAIRDQRGLAPPIEWSELASTLYESTDPEIANTAESIGAAFGDAAAFDRIRRKISSGQVKGRNLQQALHVLASDSSPENLLLYLQLLEDSQLSASIIPQLARFNDSQVSEILLTRLSQLPEGQKSAAMEVLCSRIAWANLLLDHVAEGRIPKEDLTAFYARQMASLGSPELNARLEKEWGKLGQSSEDLKQQIAQLSAAYKSAPLWAYSAGAGEVHFRRLCAQCHLPTLQSSGGNPAAIAPKLAGSSSKGIDYLVENVIDPNAVIGRDFQARIIVTKEGRVITGLIEKESPTALTVRTLNENNTVTKNDIEEIQISQNSFMPAGLLKSLNDRERIELFKYLMGL